MENIDGIVSGKSGKTEVVIRTHDEYGSVDTRRLATPEEAKIIESLFIAGKRALEFYHFGITQNKLEEKAIRAKVEAAILTCEFAVDEFIPGCNGYLTVYCPLLEYQQENRKRLLEELNETYLLKGRELRDAVDGKPEAKASLMVEAEKKKEQVKEKNEKNTNLRNNEKTI